MTTWYHHEELKDEEAGARRQPEFGLKQDVLNEKDDQYVEVPLAASTADNLTEEEQELIDRANELGDIVDDITQPYPTVSGDV